MAITLKTDVGHGSYCECLQLFRLETGCLAFRGVRRSTCLREILTHDWPGGVVYAATARDLLSEERYLSTAATSSSAGTSPIR